MDAHVTPALAACLARNSSPVPGDPNARQRATYGVSARLHEDVIEAELTFLAGAAYCCHEWGCHLALRERKPWHGLRKALADVGVVGPPLLELRLTVVVEQGAMFFDFRRPLPSPRGRGWYEFAAEEARRYQVVVREGADS